MRLVEVYRCLCDETRLRILHLLSQQPLCVCHFQEILKATQVKISKHLAYLRAHRLVETKREGTWIIYSLPAQPTPELEMNLRCLQDCCREQKIFMNDLRRMAAVLARCEGPMKACGVPRRNAKRRTERIRQKPVVAHRR